MYYAIYIYIYHVFFFFFLKGVKITDRKATVKMHLPEDKIGLHLRGGGILPVQRPDVTTTYR